MLATLEVGAVPAAVVWMESNSASMKRMNSSLEILPRSHASSLPSCVTGVPAASGR
jgi:hypothetical protein